MAKRDVLSDDALEQMSAEPRAKWGREEWIAFQEGWCYQRLGFPKAPSNGADVYFSVGEEEAAHFQGVPSPHS